ncbi:glycosyltransferase family 4 protein [Uliginosibacterium sp. H3]|uniref:Glycosyltransferase family 4 protein n=1 Tax=Uliginosibacterium silvisoli TaxID=3114758 RepID=A0ABU6K3E6_9RHOO|nr:glycosyltransferase family 4 protein [Uliginosibacterium sp. H3]
MALLVWAYFVQPSSKLLWALLPGGALVAVIGFWDDHVSLPARTRFACHVLAAMWAVACLGGWPVLEMGVANWAWGWFGSMIAVLALVWATNLYNFMDGIDGLAGSQAVFVGGVGGLLLWLSGGDGMPCWLLAAASAGFLAVNWPPARIFMGDVGSGFLGFVIGVLALHATVTDHTTIWPWVILMAVFAVDATFTLCRRALTRVRVTEAHRSHAYQRASQRIGNHRAVTLTVLAINALFLAPASLVAHMWPALAVPLTIVCWGGLSALAWFLDAGRLDVAS